MSKSIKAAIVTQSRTRAMDQIFQCAKQGLSQRQVIQAMGQVWSAKNEPTWEDVIDLMASLWRNRCTDPYKVLKVHEGTVLAKPNFKRVMKSSTPKALPKPTAGDRACLKCRSNFYSTGPGNRLCISCSESRQRYDDRIAEKF